MFSLQIPPASRILMALFAVGMFFAIQGGLARSYTLPIPLDKILIAQHGTLMAGVLLPGLIALERAVAIARPWAWSAPLLAVLAALSVLTSSPASLSILLTLALALGAQHFYLWKQSPGLGSLLPMLASAVLAWSHWHWGQGQTPATCAVGWANFLILIIAAERLEFSFIAKRQSTFMLLSLLIMLAGLVLPWPQGTGLSWLLLAAWLTRYDIARRNARRQGFAAYTARSVLLGYFWMGISGLMLLWKGLPYLAGPHFERTLHGVFVGFVFSMIFAHGPIIFPALCKLPVRFSSWFYLPLACLHLSLLLRWLLNPNWGALGNFLAMLVFALTMITHYQPGHNPWLPKLESDQSPTAA